MTQKPNKKLVILLVVVLIVAGLFFIEKSRYQKIILNNRQVMEHVNVEVEEGCSYDGCHHNCYKTGVPQPMGISCSNTLYVPSTTARCVNSIDGSCELVYAESFLTKVIYEIKLFELSVLNFLYR